MFAASTKCSLINKVAEIVTSVYKLSVADPGEGLGVGRKGGAGPPLFLDQNEPLPPFQAGN